MADPATVRSVTGFSIGGVAPVGLASEVPVLLDEDLMAFEQVWAAAGTARAVFPVAPDDLKRITGARAVRVTSTS
ncbi:MAG: YbaK/EbsC family protein [Trueperaceae bacterium]|nr:YbaK/EbsC family protein [Trueperaceae bacterium]